MVETMKKKRTPMKLIACYMRDVYRLGGNIDRGYVVVDVAGYRTIFPVPTSVIVDLERAGVKRLGGKRGRFKSVSEMRSTLRELGVRRTS